MGVGPNISRCCKADRMLDMGFEPQKLSPVFEVIWVAVKKLNLRLLYSPPIMENQMEKKMANEMETGGI